MRIDLSLFEKPFYMVGLFYLETNDTDITLFGVYKDDDDIIP